MLSDFGDTYSHIAIPSTSTAPGSCTRLPSVWRANSLLLVLCRCTPQRTDFLGWLISSWNISCLSIHDTLTPLENAVQYVLSIIRESITTSSVLHLTLWCDCMAPYCSSGSCLHFYILDYSLWHLQAWIQMKLSLKITNSVTLGKLLNISQFQFLCNNNNNISLRIVVKIRL